MSETTPNPRRILHLVIDVGETFAAAVAPLQAEGRWPKGRARP